MNTEEKQLRNIIQGLIGEVRTKKLNEEKELRGIIRSMLKYELKILNERQTADIDPTPNKSTGINVLEELLKKIIPILESDYKSMTTNNEQRESFRAHIVQAIISTLTPVEANTSATQDTSLEERINIDLVDDDKFIDIRTDAEKKADEEPEDPRQDFGIQGADETGRNIAYASFKKIETAIIDSYELLSNPEDQELFYDYLIANLKLYFDKFEDELKTDLPEPTTPEYEEEKSDLEGAPVEDEMPEDEPEVEI